MNNHVIEFILLVSAEIVAAALLSWFALLNRKVHFSFPAWKELVVIFVIAAIAIYVIYVRWPLGLLIDSGLVAMVIVPAMYFSMTWNSKSQQELKNTNLSKENTLPQSTQAKKPCIYVFLPDPKRKTEEAFYQDGALQEEGFIAAEQEAQKEGIHRRLAVKYHSMARNDSGEALLNSMKQCYETECATYFIMTMSSKARMVRDHFIEWHRECVSTNNRVPILIVTVASAPDLTVASTPAHPSIGIVRWYVRSQEESSLIALYIRWKHDVKQAVVFREKDFYGEHGRDEFCNRFTSLALEGKLLGDFAIAADEAKSKVKEFIGKLKQHPESTAAVVIGYGNSLSRTVTELIEQKFSGLIACASTLTGPEWQPISKEADGRIVTVLPRMRSPIHRLDGKDRDVVFYFAKSTLLRVIELTSEDANPKTFVERWRKRANTSRLCEEHLADGDTSIKLEIAYKPDQWR